MTYDRVGVCLDTALVRSRDAEGVTAVFLAVVLLQRSVQQYCSISITRYQLLQVGLVLAQVVIVGPDQRSEAGPRTAGLALQVAAALRHVGLVGLGPQPGVLPALGSLVGVHYLNTVL